MNKEEICKALYIHGSLSRAFNVALVDHGQPFFLELESRGHGRTYAVTLKILIGAKKFKLEERVFNSRELAVDCYVEWAERLDT